MHFNLLAKKVNHWLKFIKILSVEPRTCIAEVLEVNIGPDGAGCVEVIEFVPNQKRVTQTFARAIWIEMRFDCLVGMAQGNGWCDM